MRLMHLDPTPTANGLYLYFPDGRSLALTAEFVDARSRAILAERERALPGLRLAAEFQLCSVCPLAGSAETCHAIRPLLVVSECVTDYPSYTRVTAAFRTGGSGENTQAIVAETTLQRALQYVALLSLLYYCEVGREYWRYFHGTHPLMEVQDVAVRVYLNMFWACDGDRERTRALVARFHEEIAVTIRCQMDRLRLVSGSEALGNAVVLTQVASEFLADHIEEVAADRMQRFGAAFF